MAASTVSRLGQVNAAGDAKAIFLEVYSGLVLNSFNNKQTTMDKVMKRNITSGKSAQFPAIGRASGQYHSVGSELSGNAINHAKVTINIEDVLVSDVFVAEIDEFMNHYEVRAEYALQQGEYLADRADSNNFRAIHAGALETSPTVTGGPVGQDISDINMAATDVATFKGAIYDAARYLDENNVPESNRYLAVAPNDFYRLLQDGDFIDRDYAGEGSKARAQLPWASDLMVIKTNNIPTTDEATSTPADVPTSLHKNFTGLLACIWHTSAVGNVHLMGLRSESDYLIKEQGTFMVSKYALGQGFIRPESCITLLDT